ncbi:uncharacterized protein [Nicotiana tomentosiformis]|uniref:uncharacterized protein n=1 Tax=Nicotiana tomentosiformis TaxID=4098 RepID=UPI00388C89E8
MVRTRTTRSSGRTSVPPARAARGWGRGRGRGVAHTVARAALVDPPITPAQEQIPDVVKPARPTQAPTVPIDGGGAQTPVARTPEQVVQELQTPGVLPALSVVVAQAQVGSPMSDKEQKKLERFGRLRPPAFSGVEFEDALDFLDKCQRIFRTTSILEISGVLFTTFRLSGAAFIWWEAYELSRHASAAPLTWHDFSVLFLEKFCSTDPQRGVV